MDQVPELVDTVQQKTVRSGVCSNCTVISFINATRPNIGLLAGLTKLSLHF